MGKTVKWVFRFVLVFILYGLSRFTFLFGGILKWLGKVLEDIEWYRESRIVWIIKGLVGKENLS